MALLDAADVEIDGYNGKEQLGEAENHNLATVKLSTLKYGLDRAKKLRVVIECEPEYQERAMRRVPAGRLGQPEELVGALIFLLSDSSRMVTGHILAVDGGTLAS